MNKTLITELERINDSYPYRVLELETLDGRRIRITKRFRKLWTEEEKQDGDIKIENGLIAFLRYDELRDIIYFPPPWQRPFSWIFNHPEWVAIVLISLMWGFIIGISLETCSINAFRSAAQTEQQKK
jgi:hypothetical protein